MEGDNLYEKLQEAGFKPFKGGTIDNLTAQKILGKDVFDYIFSFDEPTKRGQVILEFQTKAKKLGVITPFKETLEECKKNYKKMKRMEEKQTENEKKITHNEVAEILIKEENIIKYEDDLYIYENGVYTINDKALGRKVIEIKPDATTRFRSEVYNYLQLSSNIKKMNFDRDCGIINFKNGLYNLKTKEFTAHNPNIFTTNQINANYNPNAEKVQAIDDVLDKLSDYKIERKQALLEMIGYCMTTSVKLQKAFILYGNTAQNGKSTLLDIIGELLGEENIAKVPFKDMNQNKFACAGIKNKLLNSGSEMTDEYIIDVMNFKQFITGDYLEIEQKYKERQKIHPYAKFIFNANELPKVADKTNGFYRRLHIIPLEYSFTNKDRKTFDFSKIISSETLEYLAKIALEAFEKMGENFTNYEESEKEVDKYRIETNSVLSFINDEDYIVEFIETATSTKYASEVYEHYKKYCIVNQWKPIGRNKFYKEIEKSELICYIGNQNHQKTYTLNKKFYEKNNK